MKQIRELNGEIDVQIIRYLQPHVSKNVTKYFDDVVDLKLWNELFEKVDGEERLVRTNLYN